MKNQIQHHLKSTTTFLLLLFFVASGFACGEDDADGNDANGNSNTENNDTENNDTENNDTENNDQETVPTIASTIPENDDVDVYLNDRITVAFSIMMDEASLTDTVFTLTSGDPAVEVSGDVVYYDDSRSVFWPDTNLDADTEYTATITTGAESTSGVALAEDYEWSFTTGDEIRVGHPVDLATAGDYVILAKSAVSTEPISDVWGDIGLSPAAASYLTGFSLTVDSTNEFSESDQVTGNLYASDYTQPTPKNLTTAISDMELAFTDAAGRAADFTELHAGDISGQTLEPGVYKWGTGVSMSDDVTLDGSDTDVWIFQIDQDLTMSSGTSVILDGAVAENVFWQVAGEANVGTTAHLEGVVLSKTAIVLKNEASVNGRLLAQTAVTLDENMVVEPVE